VKKLIYILIITIGFLQVIGYLSGIKAIRGLGLASASSPLPIVFTEVKGVETFASDFFIHYTDSSGAEIQAAITPHMYSKLKGPYNRRNIYGAAISYGPVLKKELWESVFNYGLCKQVLLREMELPLSGKNYFIRIETKTSGRNDAWNLKYDCAN
jgi:hypothetical protein